MYIKRSISFMLSAFLVLCSVSPGYAYDDAHWASKSIKRMEDMGIVQGNEDGEFMPDNYITRAEMFTILNRIIGATEMTGKTFIDVGENSWYRNQIDIAVTDGYVTGYSDGSIQPENYITREEAATVISRIFPSMEYEECEFSDNEDISSWALEGICILKHLGIMAGYEDGSVRPRNFITRAEAAEIFSKLIGVIKSDKEKVTNQVIEGNLIITAGGVTFDNVTVKGNVYITNSANSDEVRFIDCTIDGGIYQHSGNDKAIVLESSTTATVSLGGNGGQLVLTGKSAVDKVYVQGDAALSSPEYTGEAIEEIYAKGNCKVSVDANSLIIEDTCDIVVEKNYTISHVKVLSEAVGASIDVDGVVEEFETDASCLLNGKTLNAGYKAKKLSQETVKYSSSYSGGSSGGGSSGGGSSGGGSSGGGSSVGGSSGLPKPDSGADLGEQRIIEVSNIALSDELVFAPEFSKDVTDYYTELEFDDDEIGFIVNCTDGAKLLINGSETNSGEEFVLSEISEGDSAVVIELFDGIRPVSTYKINISKAYSSPEGTLEALNNVFKTTVDANEDISLILEAFSNANIDGAIVLFCEKYKEAYDLLSVDSDLDQRQFMDMIEQVNNENANMLDKVIGVKDAGGYVYSDILTVDTTGLYAADMRFAATADSVNKKLAVYVDGERYESPQLSLSSTAGWVTGKFEIPLTAGDNPVEIYAETEDDGNFGLLVDDISITSDRYETSVLKLEAEDNYKYTTYKSVLYGNLTAGYTSSDKKSVGGGSVFFRFNSPKEQQIKITAVVNRANGNSDGIYAFFNPVAAPEKYTEQMQAGVDYPLDSEAVIKDERWTGAQVPLEFEIELTAEKGENLFWFPARNLVYISSQNTDVYMYTSGNLTVNKSTFVDYIEIEPVDFPVVVSDYENNT